MRSMLSHPSQVIEDEASFIIYGPFNINGEFTSESNADFDAMLRKRDPKQGIRDLTELQAAALEHGLHLKKQHDLPANNLIAVFKKLCSI